MEIWFRLIYLLSAFGVLVSTNKLFRIKYSVTMLPIIFSVVLQTH